MSLLLSGLQDIIWDVILFSETRTATGTYIFDNGAKLITSRGEQTADGVAILVHKDLLSSVVRVRKFGGRLIFVDLRMQDYTVRMISIYCPHAGYSFDDLQRLYFTLTDILKRARQANYHVILGGDFNTVLNAGDRGALLNDITREFKLQVVNDPEKISFEDRWTFQSCLGTRRQIDYIFCSSKLAVKYGQSTCALDLGSDHRAVNSEIYCIRNLTHRHTPKPRRGWRPSPIYKQSVGQDVQCSASSTLQELQAILVKNSEASVEKEDVTLEKPWKSQVVRDLVDRRRKCADKMERRSLSKLSTSVIDLDLRISFEDDWEDWVKGDEWNKLVEKASEGLTRKRNMQAKGKGKGKAKGTSE